MKCIRHWPILHIYIEIPFVSVRTMLMGESLERATREYVMVRIQIHKWTWEFELYDTYKRIVDH